MTTRDPGWRQMVTEAKRPLANRDDDFYGFTQSGFDWFDNARRSGWMLKIPNGRIDKVYVVDPNDFALHRVVNNTVWLEVDLPHIDRDMTPAEIRAALEAAR